MRPPELSSRIWVLACASIVACGSFGTNTDPTPIGTDAGNTNDGGGTSDDGASDSGGPPSCPGNLMKNPDFEKNNDFWRVVNGTSINVVQVRGHTGQAGRACMKTGPYLSVTDDPVSVTGAKQGSTYRLTAWLRADGIMERPLVANLRERESSTGTIIDKSNKAIDPIASWNDVTVERTITGAGSQLEVYFSIDDSPAAGSCIEVDDVCLQLLP
jgi:hypothetical protein